MSESIQLSGSASEADISHLGETSQCECAVCLSSTPNKHGPRVSTAVLPFVDESLISIAVRTAGSNHLPRVSRLLDAADGVYHAFVNLASRNDVDFDQLAWACRLPAHEIDDRRYRETMIHSTLPGLDFHGAYVPAYDLRLKSRRVAPSWLRQAPYHSAIGHHLLIPHCPSSGELLVDQCPRCNTKLTWSELDIRKCQACDFNLAEAAVGRISDELRDATSLMVDLIHPDPARQRAALNRLPPVLQVINRGTVFEVGWRLGAIFAGGDAYDRDQARQLTIAVRLKVLAAGSNILSAWPNSLAERLTNTDEVERRAKIMAAIRHIAVPRNAWPHHRQLLLQALPGLEKSNSTAIKLALVAGGNAAETTKALGVGQKVFERLRASNHLHPIVSAGEHNLHQIFDISSHAMLAKKLADRTGITCVSEQLGIGRSGAEQLCCLGFLDLLNDRFMRDAYVERQIAQSGLQALRQRLELGAVEIEVADRIPLYQALRIIGGREKPWGSVIAFMLNGLPYHLAKPTRWAFMTRVSIRIADVPLIAGMTFDRQAFPEFDFEQEMPRRDAERLLNITPDYLQAAIAAGELRRNANGLFDWQHVMNRACEFISGGEILMRWGKSGKTKPAPFRGRKKLERISSLGWQRSVVEQCMGLDP